MFDLHSRSSSDRGLLSLQLLICGGCDALTVNPPPPGLSPLLYRARERQPLNRNNLASRTGNPFFLSTLRIIDIIVARPEGHIERALGTERLLFFYELSLALASRLHNSEN